MTRNIRVRGIKRKQIDEDKLALAFLMLAKILHEQETQLPGEPPGHGASTVRAHDESEVA